MIYRYGTGKQKVLSADLDQALIWTAILLLSLGLVMVYSASISIAEADGSGYPAYFLIRHAAYVAAGLLVAVVAFQVPMESWQK